jgi:hypothetical protein
MRYVKQFEGYKGTYPTDVQLAKAITDIASLNMNKTIQDQIIRGAMSAFLRYNH